jgi:hypothetical protein
MEKDPKAIVMIALKKQHSMMVPEGDDKKTEDSEDADSVAKEAAADDLMEALEKKDSKAFVEALQSLLSMCKGKEDSETDDDSDEEDSEEDDSK